MKAKLSSAAPGQPLYIALDGGEGSGKSTIISLLKEHYPDALFVREPGGSAFAEMIRTVVKSPAASDATPLALMCAMFAARADTIAKEINPAMLHDRNVISDRSIASTYAYQIGAGNAPELEDLFYKMRRMLLRTPDIYIFLDVDPATGLQRARARNGGTDNTRDHFDNHTLEFHERVRRGYLAFFQHAPYIAIDANRPLDEVKAAVLEQVDALLAD